MLYALNPLLVNVADSGSLRQREPDAPGRGLTGAFGLAMLPRAKRFKARDKTEENRCISRARTR